MFKNTFLIFSFIIFQTIYAQNKETVDWLTHHSIEIEDANPDSEMHLFKQMEPEKFAEARFYGFGEASHNTKEFFDLKAKFFKYLVNNHGLRIFIMEETYQAESGINEWISGGNGDVKTIANNLQVGFWRTKEIVNLLEWMREYNKGKSKKDQIRFYGMDIQYGEKINEEIRAFIKNNNISISENLLLTADSCATKNIDFSQKESWWSLQIPKLKELKKQILNSTSESNGNLSIFRSLDYLLSYVEYASLVNDAYPKSTEFRDLKMFDNVKYILDHESKDAKAFIWAHNEHISNKEMNYTGSNILNLGSHLKRYYKNDYYSVGFDFGNGQIEGFVIDSKKGNHWKTYYIDKPYPKTYANTLISVGKENYFVDIENAVKNEPTKFFERKMKSLLIGGGGFQPKPLYKIMVKKVYAETYDGLIFVKRISNPDYKLD